MSNNFHINVTPQQFEVLVPTPDHVIIRLEEKHKGNLLLPRNESKDPLIINTGTIWKLPFGDCSFRRFATVVFEKYVGTKINIIGNGKYGKYLLIHKKHIKMQINTPVFVETDETCSDEAYARMYEEERLANLDSKMGCVPYDGDYKISKEKETNK